MWLGVSAWAFAALALRGAVGHPTEQDPLTRFAGAPVAEIKASIADIPWALRRAEIIPSVIGEDFVPIFHLDVWWSKHSYAFLGNTLRRSKVKHQPTVKLSNAGPINPIKELCLMNAQYVFTMTDPDMPRRDLPSDAEYAQWIGLALAGKSARNGRDANGYITCSDLHVTEWETILKYKRPHPRHKTGKHRYVFEAFTPVNGTLEKLHFEKPGHRKRWGFMEEGSGAKEWAAKHSLMPVAANFIFVQNNWQ